ncbi:L-rhamnose mutarotase [Pedobacter jejuensis]|uniref:L-rhamnose mutarotase n=1 Tax=Pedobacter jejuensis TaxID=1268550 RepID=A0A3N0BVN2_9SPHI|nr:L-rhamnose mutarotase [Pedobacter jejuensis]RNL53390.1 L-rhamnose mutarotase [Pedobacter jejuensis]
MKRHCFALDLIDDDKLIAEYKKYHAAVWPEILDSIKSAGVEDLEIYLFANRLFMIMEVNETFSFEAKTKSDLENPKVQEWEKLMWNYQKAMPGAKPGEKWILMENIFKL